MDHLLFVYGYLIKVAHFQDHIALVHLHNHIVICKSFVLRQITAEYFVDQSLLREVISQDRSTVADAGFRVGGAWTS